MYLTMNCDSGLRVAIVPQVHPNSAPLQCSQGCERRCAQNYVASDCGVLVDCALSRYFPTFAAAVVRSNSERAQLSHRPWLGVASCSRPSFASGAIASSGWNRNFWFVSSQYCNCGDGEFLPSEAARNVVSPNAIHDACSRDNDLRTRRL
jgi:hypothetical protein